MSTTTESTALALIPPSALPTILAAAAFVAAGLDDKMARTAVMAIALGKIPHCRISY